MSLQVLSGCPEWGPGVGICPLRSGSADITLGWKVGGIHAIRLGHRDVAKKCSVLLGSLFPGLLARKTKIVLVFLLSISPGISEFQAPLACSLGYMGHEEKLFLN